MNQPIVSPSVPTVKMKTPGVLRVGTSGIALPGNKQTFPASFRDKSRLCYYSSLFNTIEINGTFYKIPREQTIRRWTNEVPASFQFTIKLWKGITHVKELKFSNTEVDLFLEKVVLPGLQQGCLLIQLPGKISVECINQLEKLLIHIASSNLPWRKVCVEFRNPTWYNDTTYSLLNQFQTAMVLHDMPASQHMTVNTTADFIYLRFHGIDGTYRGDYDKGYLNEIAKQLQQWLLMGKDVYAYFNNTMGGAFMNAQYLYSTINL